MTTKEERVTALEQSYKNLVTKDDLVELFNGLETRLNTKIDEVETRLNTKIDGVRTELLDKMDQKMNQMKEDILEAFKRGFTSNY